MAIRLMRTRLRYALLISLVISAPVAHPENRSYINRLAPGLFSLALALAAGFRSGILKSGPLLQSLGLTLIKHN